MDRRIEAPRQATELAPTRIIYTETGAGNSHRKISGSFCCNCQAICVLVPSQNASHPANLVTDNTNKEQKLFMKMMMAQWIYYQAMCTFVLVHL